MIKKITSAWILVGISIALAIVFIVVPAVRPDKVAEISEDSLVYAGEDPDGVHWYYLIKAEVRDWIGILCQLSPILTLIFAFKRKGKK